MNRLLCLIGLGLLLGACAPKSGGAKPGAKAHFSVGRPGEGWRTMDPLGADEAWYHPQLSGTIYADANCGARYEDGELGALLTHLTFGVARGEALREEPMRLDGRDALVRTYRGSLDGVSVQVGAMVTKKNDCLYDVLYIAPPARFEEGWRSFVSVIEGFRAGG